MAKNATTSSSVPETAPRWFQWLRVAWLAYAVVVLAINMWLLPYRLSQQITIGWADWSEAQSLKALADMAIAPSTLVGINRFFNMLVPFLYLGLAGVIFWKKSSDRAGLWWALVFVTWWSPFADLGRVNPSWSFFGEMHDAFSTALSFAALYGFPDGRFRPGWTRVAALAVAATQVWRLLQPDDYQRVFPVVAGGIFLSIALAQVYRYMRLSSPSQRQQIKWVVFGLAVCAVPLAVYMLVVFSTPALRQPTAAGMAAYLVGFLLWLVFALALPVSFFIAIFRSGLWDIDLVIRRTLVYSMLTVLLGLVFFGGVTLLQSLFTALTGQTSPAALVISTLLIAALFNPLRRRIQDFIDRRFYRRKYDADRALAAFGAATRNEVELKLLAERLLTLVDSALQPAKISLWLKDK